MVSRSSPCWFLLLPVDWTARVIGDSCHTQLCVKLGLFDCKGIYINFTGIQCEQYEVVKLMEHIFYAVKLFLQDY